jgi:hypothetical protein
VPGVAPGIPRVVPDDGAQAEELVLVVPSSVFPATSLFISKSDTDPCSRPWRPSQVPTLGENSQLSSSKPLRMSARSLFPPKNSKERWLPEIQGSENRAHLCVVPPK